MRSVCRRVAVLRAVWPVDGLLGFPPVTCQGSARRGRIYRRQRDTGLERSGWIITSSAAIVVLVSPSFVAADIVLIKALGLGTAIAVFLDATVVRGLLVPAVMRLLGDLNWWSPRFARGIANRPAVRPGKS